MTVLPGLTSTDKSGIPRFLEELRSSAIRVLALFPTVLTSSERQALYRELESIPELAIPHVHLRTDCDEGEMQYLVERFHTEAFNIHPRASSHAFGPIPPRYARCTFVENSGIAAEDDEVAELGGICPDYSHLENARLQGRTGYVEATERQLVRFPIGCCHVSAIRVGEPNTWAGEWDHHRFRELSNLDYMTRYRGVLPDRWVSLELENGFAEQVSAAAYLASLLERAAAPTRARSG